MKKAIIMLGEFGPYYEAAKPGKRERLCAWATPPGRFRRWKDGRNVVANDVVNDVAKLGVKRRQAQRIIVALKEKAGLTRRGADKNGEWHFESPEES